MKDNNVNVLGLPSHTTHYLQPADRAYFKSFKHYWRLEGRAVTKESGADLDRTLFLPVFSKASSKAATPSNAMAGCQGSGIYPLNSAHIMLPSLRQVKKTEKEHQDRPASVPPTHHTLQHLLQAHPLQDPMQAAMHPPRLSPDAHLLHGPLQQQIVPTDSAPGCCTTSGTWGWGGDGSGRPTGCSSLI